MSNPRCSKINFKWVFEQIYNRKVHVPGSSIFWNVFEHVGDNHRVQLDDLDFPPELRWALLSNDEYPWVVKTCFSYQQTFHHNNLCLVDCVLVCIFVLYNLLWWHRSNPFNISLIGKIVQNSFYRSRVLKETSRNMHFSIIYEAESEVGRLNAVFTFY